MRLAVGEKRRDVMGKIACERPVDDGGEADKRELREDDGGREKILEFKRGLGRERTGL